jgi:hypothetical protein
MTPIEELFVNTDELDQELLVTVLKPYLMIDPKKLSIRPQAKWKGASNRTRIVAYLLARKAMQAHGLIEATDEAVSNGSIISHTGIPAGSVHPTLKDLFEARPQIVDKDADGKYLVPTWAVANACEILTE